MPTAMPPRVSGGGGTSAAATVSTSAATQGQLNSACHVKDNS
jgi:hypothetical protein